MKLHIEITMDNAAFEEPGRDLEVIRILKDATDNLALYSPDESWLRDSNGNTCGRAWTTED